MVLFGISFVFELFYDCFKTKGGQSLFLAELIMKFKGIISIFINTFSVALVYKLLAAGKYPFKLLLPGGFVAAFGCLLYSELFSVYLKYFSSHSIIYGSMGLVPITMLWVYSLVTILFVGAEVNLYLCCRNMRYHKSMSHIKKE